MDVNLNIEKKDIKFVKEFLTGKSNPVELDDIAYQLALFKTQDNRAHKVKIYNPDCEYKINDLIYKEYPGKIPVGSKKYIEIDQGVVLKVIEVRTRFGIEEIKLSYEGTSEFKKYISYLERQKIELLLPHKQQKPSEKPEFLPQESDPRQQQAPLETRHFCVLKRKLAGMLNKEADIAFISDKALLRGNLKPIDSEVFNKIRNFLKEDKQSETTEFFVENFAGVKPGDPEFDSYCFALNYSMATDYKIDFQQTRMEGWGKWNLISVIYYMKKDSPISEENPLANKVFYSNKKNILQRRRKFEEGIFPEGNTRYYLTQREVYAGAVKLKSSFLECGDSIEIELIDGKSKKSHLFYYYSEENLLLGFKDIFEKYIALQGTILTFEPLGDEQWQFTIRTTKKGTIADKIQYVPEKKAFKVVDEKIASQVFVNKAMFLESDIFQAVYEKIDEYRAIETLNKLIHKIFLEFGIKERNYEIHILRLYHILDLVYPIDLKQVEEVILCNSEFIPSEKLSGVFYLDSSALASIEEEESRRQVEARDESKKKREELRRKKIEEERQLQEAIRRKREERRRKREQEMWEKERLKKEKEEKKALELRQKKEALARKKAAAAARAERRTKAKSRERERERERIEPTAPEAKRAPMAREPLKRKPEYARPKPVPMEEMPVKEPHHKKVKKKIEEDKPKSVKAPKRPERKPLDEGLSEDEIKSQIQLEELKAKLIEQKRRDERKPEKEKKVAYQDKGGEAVGGIFASKLDEIVKKDKDKDKKEK